MNPLDGVTGTRTAASSASTLGAYADRTSIGRDQFLNLLVTQLRNQDPTSPLQPHEFAAQLAQFSSVEQLAQLNDGIALLQQQGEMQRLMSEVSFSSNLIGRHVTAEGNQVWIAADRPGEVTFEVGTGGGNATLVLKDAQGKEVARRDLGVLAAGKKTMDLPGDLPAGKYTYAVEVKSTDGKAVPVTTYTSGVVDGVRFHRGTILLTIGGLEVALDALTDVTPARPTSTEGTNP